MLVSRTTQIISIFVNRALVDEKNTNLVGSELYCGFGHDFQDIKTIAYTQ